MENAITSAVELNDAKKFVLGNIKGQISGVPSARIYLQGSAGIGKSEILKQICKENGYRLVVKYISNLAFEQLTGLPIAPKQGETAMWSQPDLLNFSSPEYMPENFDENGITVLVLDDFHLADKGYQKYLFQLLTYGGLQGYKLPKNTAIVLAGNRSEDKAGANTILSPVCNRIQFFPVEAKPESWVKNYALKNGVRFDVISFIESHPTMLCGECLENTAFASPRSWTYLSNQLNQFENLEINELQAIARGYIGDEYTKEFVSFTQLYMKWDFVKMQKQDFESVKQNMKSAAEKNPVEIYAIMNSGVSYIINAFEKANRKLDDEKLKNALDFVYKVFAFILVMKLKYEFQSRPLVVAGTQYLFNYQKSVENRQIQKEKSLVCAFLSRMKEETAIDLVFYGVLAEILEFPLSDKDKATIEKAMKEVNENQIK